MPFTFWGLYAINRELVYPRAWTGIPGNIYPCLIQSCVIWFCQNGGINPYIRCRSSLFFLTDFSTSFKFPGENCIDHFCVWLYWRSFTWLGLFLNSRQTGKINFAFLLGLFIWEWRRISGFTLSSSSWIGMAELVLCSCALWWWDCFFNCLISSPVYFGHNLKIIITFSLSCLLPLKLW